MLNSVAYYTSEDIIKDKEIVFNICGEKHIARQVCTSHPNPSVANLKDISILFDKEEEKDSYLPTFFALSTIRYHLVVLNLRRQICLCMFIKPYTFIIEKRDNVSRISAHLIR